MRSAMILTAGQGIAYGCSFLRNMILARALTKADFGLAAAFSMTMMLLELAGRMSFGLQIVQSKDGEDPDFVGTSQTFQFVVGVFSALLIVAMCKPLAVAFGVPDQAWAFAMLAAIPLLRSFENLGVGIRQRRMEFVQVISVEVIPQIIITLAAWPMAVWLGDYRVILWLMLARAVLAILLTHVLSPCRMHWSFKPEYAKSMFAFSWPLLLNGLFMFGSQQGDQMIVGSFLSLEDLAIYAVSFSLVSIPWFVFARVTSQLMLPLLSRAQDDLDEFRRRYCTCLRATSFASVMILGPLVAIGEEIITLCYGHKYAGAGQITALLGVASGFRFLRLTPAIAATARADTKNQLYSNIWRIISLPAALAVAFLGGGMLPIAICVLGGEIVAGANSVLRLSRRNRVPVRDHLRPVLLLTVCLGAALTVPFVVPHWSLGVGSLILALVWGFGVAATWVLMPEVLTKVWQVASARIPGLRAPFRTA